MLAERLSKLGAKVVHNSASPPNLADSVRLHMKLLNAARSPRVVPDSFAGPGAGGIVRSYLRLAFLIGVIRCGKLEVGDRRSGAATILSVPKSRMRG
jgi:hypothetical protein